MTALTESELNLQQKVMDLAKFLGWRVVHFRPARTEKGRRTPLEGDAGFPDLVLARDGKLLVVELKSAIGKLSPDQILWLAALGPHGRVWRPGSWDEIHAELQRPTPEGGAA